MSLSISQLAADAGVNIQTVRYYERRGLLAVPPRTAAGYRCYPADAADRLRFIKRAQELGFSLDEVSELLALRSDHDPSACATVEARTRQKIAHVEAKVRDLRRLKSVLECLAAACAARAATAECPVLESLARAR